MFEQVDLTSAKFLREYVFVRYDGSSERGPYDELLKPESMAAMRAEQLGRP